MIDMSVIKKAVTSGVILAAGSLVSLTILSASGAKSESLASVQNTAAAQSTADKLGDEAAEILSKYIQIDTTNPPGNEQLGAEYLASILRKEGFEPQIIPTAPGRACVYARLKGSGKKKAIVLLNHIDVVPAQAQDWKYAPFGGQVHDGELWGRGTLDMKGMGVAELVAMLQIKRSGAKLDRDIIFLATPDEEVGGDAGAKWFKEHHPELVKDAEFLLNEGFQIEADPSLKARYWGIDFAEKSILWLRLTAKGEAGHASMPLSDSAPNKLVRALDRLVSAQPDVVVSPLVKQYFASIASLQPAQMQAMFQNIDKAVADPKQWQEIAHDKLKSAMLMNTVSLTVMKAGYKTNVIPAEALAELDCRLLPDTKKDEFIAHIKSVLNDPAIDVQAIEWERADASAVNTALFDAIKAVAQEETPPSPVVPVVVGWFTDSHWFRELGLTAYGFEPFEVDMEHLGTVHGKNERIPLPVLTKGVHRMQAILLKVAGAQN